MWSLYNPFSEPFSQQIRYRHWQEGVMSCIPSLPISSLGGSQSCFSEATHECSTAMTCWHFNWHYFAWKHERGRRGNDVCALLCSLGPLELKNMLQYLNGFQLSCLSTVTGTYLILLRFVVLAFYLANVAELVAWCISSCMPWTVSC